MKIVLLVSLFGLSTAAFTQLETKQILTLEAARNLAAGAIAVVDDGGKTPGNDHGA